ncbi:MAG: hypothetical protein LC624_02985 [Halobacteriales archaeon]|nr:hypothetical protein [Halobacteriales archaeon]
MRARLLAGLALAIALSGCMSANVPSSSPGPSYCCGDGPWFMWNFDGLGWAVMAALVMAALVLIACSALVLLAVVARGPSAQLAGVLLAALGGLVLLSTVPAAAPLGALVGMAFVALGAAAAWPAPRLVERSIVLGER